MLLPFLTRDRFEDVEATFGILLAALGIGGAFGSLVVSSLKLPRRYLSFMILCRGGGTLPLALHGTSDNLWIMLAALFIVGAATGARVVIWGTLLQRLVPPDMIGRVASLDFFVSIAFMPVSIAPGEERRTRRRITGRIVEIKASGFGPCRPYTRSPAASESGVGQPSHRTLRCANDTLQ
ncbi:hypothetical protein GCM10009786_14180 [Leucobacter alluvii]|uniref:Cation/H+ exchanger domain-containing protein n=1 Tax=Leucobacter alluvii TaxID=340321 RepID=A0ABN3B542_9MICO